MWSIPVHASNTHSIDLERGSSQYLTRADTASLSITGDVTIEAWINVESTLSTGQVHNIVNKFRSGDNNRSYIFRYRESSGIKLQLVVSDDGINAEVLQIAHTPSLGVWYHVAVSWDASASLAKFYINGTQTGGDQTGAMTSIFDSGSDFRIGATAETSPDGFFDGLIDEVRVWNDIRTPTEITNNKDIELTGSEGGLVGYWKLNSSLADETSNANNLSNINSALFSTNTPFGISEEASNSQVFLIG